MTTPNNKSWGERLEEMECTGYSCGHETLEDHYLVGKQFISSLLEQERKDERQRVLSECIGIIKKTSDDDLAYRKRAVEGGLMQHLIDSGSVFSNEIITKLNQLKEE